MPDLECDVVVVGAGVAGAGMACSLREQGLDVIVVEALPATPQVNRGDHLQPSAQKLLAEIGALPFLLARGAGKYHVQKSFGPEGDLLAQFDLRTLPEPYNFVLSLRHPEIMAGLGDAAQQLGARLIRGVKVVDLLQDAQGVVHGVRGEGGGETWRIHADVVAGCDGPTSRVRQLAGITTSMQPYPYQFVMLTSTYPADQAQDEGREFWTPEGFVAMFPIGNGFLRCPVQSPPGDLARWRRVGLEAMRKEIAHRVPAWSEIEITDDDLHAYKVLKHNAETYVADGLVLVGDSAHCTAPFLGFGMASGLRDGRRASAVIASARRAGRRDRQALLAYEEQCRPFNQRVIDLSDAYSRVATAKAKTNAEVRELMSKHAGGRESLRVLARELDADY